MSRSVQHDHLATRWCQAAPGQHGDALGQHGLNSIFEGMLLVKKAKRGDSLATSSPGMNPYDTFTWGYIKYVLFNPMPASLQEFKAIPEVIVRKEVYGMMKREGKAFEGELALRGLICKVMKSFFYCLVNPRMYSCESSEKLSQTQN